MEQNRHLIAVLLAYYAVFSEEYIQECQYMGVLRDRYYGIIDLNELVDIFIAAPGIPSEVPISC